MQFHCQLFELAGYFEIDNLLMLTLAAVWMIEILTSEDMRGRTQLELNNLDVL